MNVPFSVMSTTVRHAFGDMSSAGTGKLAAALLTSTPGRPNAASAASNAAAMLSGSRMSQVTVSAGIDNASIASRPAARCSSFRLAITMDAPSLPNSVAIALPRPVPPPVTKTHTPSNVPAGSADSPAGGGAGSPIASAIRSAPSEARLALIGACGAQLCEVVALVDERLVDHLVVHRRTDLRHREMTNHLTCHLDGDRGCFRDLLGNLTSGRIEFVGGDHSAHDAVSQRLWCREHPAREHHVADQSMSAHLVEHGNAPGVGDHAIGGLGKPEAGVFGSNSDVTHQRALERAAHDPALARHDHGRVDLPELLDPPMSPAHELMVGQLHLQVADRAHIAA